MDLHQELLDKLDLLRCKKPTPIEMKTLPIILEGRDLLAEKSFENPNSHQLAYLICIMQSCIIHQMVEDELESTDKNPPPYKPQAIIIVPSQKMTIEAMDAAKKLSDESSTKTAVGSLQMLKNAKIVISTPDQLLKLVEKKKLNFENLKIIVVDGADQMLDEGLDSKIVHFCQNKTMPAKGDKQLLMFSKTMPISVMHFSHSFLKNHVFFTVNNFAKVKLNSDITCPVCKMKFNGNYYLKRHVSAVHNKEKGFKCKGCPKKFSNLQNCKRHELRHE